MLAPGIAAADSLAGSAGGALAWTDGADVRFRSAAGVTLTAARCARGDARALAFRGEALWIACPDEALREVGEGVTVARAVADAFAGDALAGAEVVALAGAAETLWLAGADRRIWRAAVDGMPVLVAEAVTAVEALAVDGDVLWVIGGGLVWRWAGEHWEALGPSVGTSIALADDGAVWLAGDDGLWSLDRRGDLALLDGHGYAAVARAGALPYVLETASGAPSPWSPGAFDEIDDDDAPALDQAGSAAASQPSWLPSLEIGVRLRRTDAADGDRRDSHELWIWFRWRQGGASTSLRR